MEAIGGVPSKALTTAPPTGESTGPLGAREGSEMALDTRLCSPVVSERASSERGDWLWWLRGARRLCSLASCARKSRGRSVASVASYTSCIILYTQTTITRVWASLHKIDSTVALTQTDEKQWAKTVPITLYLWEVSTLHLLCYVELFNFKSITYIIWYSYLQLNNSNKTHPFGIL